MGEAKGRPAPGHPLRRNYIATNPDFSFRKLFPYSKVVINEDVKRFVSETDKLLRNRFPEGISAERRPAVTAAAAPLIYFNPFPFEVSILDRFSSSEEIRFCRRRSSSGWRTAPNVVRATVGRVTEFPEMPVLCSMPEISGTMVFVNNSNAVIPERGKSEERKREFSIPLSHITETSKNVFLSFAVISQADFYSKPVILSGLERGADPARVRVKFLKGRPFTKARSEKFLWRPPSLFTDYYRRLENAFPRKLREDRRKPNYEQCRLHRMCRTKKKRSSRRFDPANYAMVAVSLRRKTRGPARRGSTTERNNASFKTEKLI